MPNKEAWSTGALLNNRNAIDTELRKRSGVDPEKFLQIHTGRGCRINRRNIRLEGSGFYDADALQLPWIVFVWECSGCKIESAETGEISFA